jgi:hypothetical protein
MNQEENSEVHRLCALLEAIDKTLPPKSPLREGLQKGAIALQTAFIHGYRRWVEDMYALQFLKKELTDEQQALLLRLGIDPEADPDDA